MGGRGGCAVYITCFNEVVKGQFNLIHGILRTHMLDDDKSMFVELSICIKKKENKAKIGMKHLLFPHLHELCTATTHAALDSPHLVVSSCPKQARHPIILR